jgi:hypothetical protein
MQAHSFVLAAHLLGVCFGMGGTLILDLRLLRLVRGSAIDSNDVLFAQFLSRFVQVGLVLLWASGIGFFALASDGPGSLLASEKLQAKLVVVVALTLNGILIGGLAVPLLSQNVGRPLFHGVSEIQRSILVASAAVSSVSWLTPFVLGCMRAFDAPVSAVQILEIYLLLAGTAVVVALLGTRILYQPAGVPFPEAAVTALREAFHEKRGIPAGIPAGKASSA